MLPFRGNWTEQWVGSSNHDNKFSTVDAGKYEMTPPETAVYEQLHDSENFVGVRVLAPLSSNFIVPSFWPFNGILNVPTLWRE